MFRTGELEQLQRRKERLVAESDANRAALLSDLRELQSPRNWFTEAGGFLLRHPGWVTAAAAAAGTMAFKTLRGSKSGGAGRWGKLASMAVLGWRLFRKSK